MRPVAYAQHILIVSNKFLINNQFITNVFRCCNIKVEMLKEMTHSLIQLCFFIKWHKADILFRF